MTTVRDIIEGSLRLIEELGAGQTATAEDCADALVALTGMIDSWSIQGGSIFTESVETFNLTGGDSEYTIGTGGDFNTTRPVRLRAATYQLSGDTYTYGLEILSMEEYAYQVDKDVTGTPHRVYFDGGYPLAKLRFHPVPASGSSVTLYSEKPLTTYTSINDTLVLPPGYERALRFNLAVEIAPEFGKQASPTVIAMAVESKQAIESKNMENDKNTMQADDALIGRDAYNIFTGY